MASVAKVPAAHKDAADRLNSKHPELVKRLPQGELNARCEYVTKLQSDSDEMESEAGNEVRGHASRVLNSLPIAEYHRKLADLDRMAHGAPGSPSPSLDMDTAKAYRASIAGVKSDHAYPPELARAFEGELAHGKAPEDIDVNSLTGWGQPASKETKRTKMEKSRRPVYRRGRKATDYGGTGWCPWEECGQLIKAGDNARAHYATHESKMAKSQLTRERAKLAEERRRLEKDIETFRAERDRRREMDRKLRSEPGGYEITGRF